MSTGENVHKWTRYFLLFFPTLLSDEYDSAPSRKYSRPFLEVFACIGQDRNLCVRQNGRLGVTFHIGRLVVKIVNELNLEYITER